jgi:hypothetical protein
MATVKMVVTQSRKTAIKTYSKIVTGIYLGVKLDVSH